MDFLKQSHGSNSSTQITIALVSTITVIGGYMLLTQSQRKRNTSKNNSDSGENNKRRMSFTSASMAMGAFPPERNVAETIINAALLFDANNCPAAADLLPLVNTVLQYERCAGIPVGTVGKNDWVMNTCENLDPKRLIRTVEISCDDDDGLYRAVEEHLQDDLRVREGLPWWEFLIIKNKGTGKSAVLVRMEHFIGDGLSIVTLFEHFITYTDGSKMEGLIPSSMSSKFKQRDGTLTLIWKSIGAIFKVLTLPASKFDDNICWRNGIGKDMVYTGTRKCLIFPTMPLDFIKDLKTAGKCTLNDIIFTALSQAIHDYCEKQNCPILKQKGESAQFRALMPVAFPRPSHETADKTKTLRNKWVFVSTDMGTGIDNLMDRLSYIHTNMTKLKKSPVAYCQLKVQETIPPLLPINIARQTVFDLFTRHSLVFSNVPGPIRECSFAGKPVAGSHFFFNNLIPQVNVLSYCGSLFMNICLDPVAIPQSETIPVLFCQALVDFGNKLNVEVPDVLLDHAKKGK